MSKVKRWTIKHDRYVADLKQPINTLEVALHFGFAEPTVRRHVKRLKLEIKGNKAYGRYKPALPAIEAMYLQGVPISKIAEAMGFNCTALSVRVYEWGIKAQRELICQQIINDVLAEHRLRADDD